MLSKVWRFLSFIGVGEHEAQEKRNIILLNRLVTIVILSVFAFLPVEILLNGFQLVPYEILSALIFAFVWFLNSRRLYVFSAYYFILMGIGLIVFATIAVGGNTNSEYNLLPIILMPMLLLKDRIQILILMIIAVIAFYFLRFYEIEQYAIAYISEEVKIQVRPVMNILTIIFLALELFYFKNLTSSYENLLRAQKEEIRLKHEDIRASINYASRIQKAILPPEKKIKELLKEYFVIYIPKDVVAGDFYWLEAKDNIVLFAAADCTGHGVPGAMVSVICNNGLNRSVKEYGLTDPGKILDKTREIVVSEFEKSEEEVKDGMDIALCSLRQNTLRYAGAHNPLVVVRKDADDCELIKPNKQPIGLFDKPEPYTTHKIELREGDSIFIFSDGFQDQFGGEKGKKFMKARFNKLLVKIAKEPMSRQRELLLNAFHEWKGEEEQVDDVCVIGVRV